MHKGGCMAEVNQQIENSRVENMAGRDIHITHIHQHASDIPRKKMIAEILQCRQRSSHFEYLINTHAEKAYGTRYFKEMSDSELEDMYVFVSQLRQIVIYSNRPSWINWIVGLFRHKTGIKKTD